MAIDFSDLGGESLDQKKPGKFDFSDLGGESMEIGDSQPQSSGYAQNFGRDLRENVSGIARIVKGVADLPWDAYQTAKQVQQGKPISQSPLADDYRTTRDTVVQAVPHLEYSDSYKGKLGRFDPGVRVAPGAIAQTYMDMAGVPIKYAPLPDKWISPEQQKAMPNPFYEKPVTSALALLPLAKPAGQLLERSGVTGLINKGATGSGRLLAGGVEKITGIPQRNVAQLFEKPGELISAPTKKVVAKAYAASELPDAPRSLAEIVERATAGPAKKVRKGGLALLEGGTDPRVLLDARKALDKQLSLLENQINMAKAGSKSALLGDKTAKLELRAQINKRLDTLAPKLRAADAVASRQLTVDPFRRLTLPGKMHFFSPEGLMRAVPGLPTAIGGGVSVAGGIAKGVKSLLRGGRSVAPTGPALSAFATEQPKRGRIIQVPVSARKLLRKAG